MMSLAGKRRQTDVRLVSMGAVGAQVGGRAYREGWAAGEKVNLSRPVKGEGRYVVR